LTKDDKWAFVAGTLIEMRDQTDKMGEVVSQLQISHESPIVTPCDKMQDSLISTLSLLVEDYFDNLSWFVFECDYGRAPKEAGLKDNMKTIRTVDDLRWVIELIEE